MDHDSIADLNKAAEILSKAKRLALLGLSHSSVQTVQSALKVAFQFKMIVDPVSTWSEKEKVFAFCQTGKSSSSLAEAGRNCETFIFWKCHFEGSKPFLDQLGLSPNKHKLIFLQNSNSPQDSQNNTFSSWPKDKIQTIRLPTDDYQTLQTLLLIDKKKDQHLSEKEILDLTGNERSVWKEILEVPGRQSWIIGSPQPLEKSSGFGSTRQNFYEMLYQLSISQQPSKPRYLHFLPNSETPSTTATQVLTWTTGFPMSVDLSDSVQPRFDPAKWNFRSLILQKHVDAILLVEPDKEILLQSDFSQETLDNLSQIPVVEISSERALQSSQVFFPCSHIGKHKNQANETIFREDGIAISISGKTETNLQPAAWWLEELSKLDTVKN